MHFLRLVGWLLAALPLAALAQKAPPDPIKFGQLDAADLGPAPFAQDSAAAVVLCDYGTTKFEGHGSDLRLVFERVTRIKILKKSGFDYASVRVPLYHQDENAEELGRVRGFTYNLEDGKVRKTPLTAPNIFSEDRTANWRLRKFTLPDVREGSVIEYTYVLKSDFMFNLQDWTFQHDIPTRWSEYRTTIPGFYRYKFIQQTNRPFDIFDEQLTTVSLGIEREVPGISGASGGLMNISAGAVASRWVMKNLPAYHDEPFTTTAEDYLIRVHFELAGTIWDGVNFHDLSQTWPRINAQLLANDNFGAQLDRGNFLKPQMLALAAKYPDLAARTAAVRAVILQSIRYDGTDRTHTTASLKRAYDAHRGTSADVNLLLLACLRDAGLPAQPVLLSTRDHGQVSRDFPLVEKFNYVVALVPLGNGKELLVDATEPLLPCGMLPGRCLNRTGRLITPAPDEGRWIDLTPPQRHTHFQQVQLTLAADGSLKGQVHREYGGYAAADERAEVTRLGEKKYLAAQTRAHTGATIPSATLVDTRDDVSKPLQVNYSFVQPAEDDSGPAGQLYLSPFAVMGLDENPFPHTERAQPVDFGASRDETSLVTLTLPAGYELAEQPKGLVAAIPNDGGRLTFGVVSNGNTVQLSSRLSLRKAVYSAAEYAQLRDVYRMLLEKQAEKLIIKKKA